MQLQDKIAIITGGESGIGKGIALAFARTGANVAIAGLSEESAKEAMREIETYGRRGVFIRTDVRDRRQVIAMVEKILTVFGTVDILVNNAGVQHICPIVELKEEDWDRVVDVHLKGTFLCTKAVLPTLIGKRSGRIVTIASAHGKVGSKFKAPYVSAKHGMIGFTKVLALEVAEYGITANCICPGYVLTPLVEKQIPDQAKTHEMTEAEVVEKILLKDVPQKRFIGVEEVADLAVYLCSESGKGITGQAISLDGGWVMQ